MATGKEGKQLRSARGSTDNDMLHAIKEALREDNVVAGLAKRIASFVMETIATQLYLASTLKKIRKIQDC